MKALAAGLADVPHECFSAVESGDVAGAAINAVRLGDSEEEQAFLLAVRRWACASLVENTGVVPLTYNGLHELLATNGINLFDDLDAMSKITLSFSKMFSNGILYGFFRSKSSYRRRRSKKKTYVI